MPPLGPFARRFCPVQGLHSELKRGRFPRVPRWLGKRGCRPVDIGTSYFAVCTISGYLQRTLPRNLENPRTGRIISRAALHLTTPPGKGRLPFSDGRAYLVLGLGNCPGLGHEVVGALLAMSADTLPDELVMYRRESGAVFHDRLFHTRHPPRTVRSSSNRPSAKMLVLTRSSSNFMLRFPSYCFSSETLKGRPTIKWENMLSQTEEEVDIGIGQFCRWN